MKRTVLTLFSATVLACTMHAYDFMVDGIAYNIISSDCAEVTFMGAKAGQEPYKGDLSIPESVTNDGTNYRVTKLGDYCFISNTGLTSVKLPESIEMIGKGVFMYDTAIETLTLPKSVKQIGEFFLSGSSIRELHCGMVDPAAVVLDENALQTYSTDFYHDHQLDKIFVPAKSMEKYLANYLWRHFDKATSNTHVLCEETGEPFEVDGIQYASIDETSNEVAIIERDDYVKCQGNIIIPTTVTQDGKLYQVTRINRRAFMESHELKSVVLPETLESLGEEAFIRCNNLESAPIPSGVTQIPDGAFNQCKLKELVISDAVTSIGKQAFYLCPLESLTLGKNLLSVGEEALTLSNLSELYHRRSRPYIFSDNALKWHNYSGCTLYVPMGTEQIFWLTSPWNGYMKIEEIDMSSSQTAKPKKKGDVNEDGEVSVADITSLVDIVMQNAE